jgi:predicted amidohydrolase
MVQMRVEQAQPEANLARAEWGIGQAAQLGCQCAVLPECLDVGWALPEALSYAEPVPGPRTDRLAAAAARHSIWVVAGVTQADHGRCYNAAVLLSPQGNLVGVHRKIHLLAGVEDAVYTVGDRLAVFDTDLGLVGLTICADNALGSLALGRALGAMGARLILSPCAWAVPAEDAAVRKPYGAEWREPYAVLARDHGLWVIGVSNVGPVTQGTWAGWVCIGNSIAMSPRGVELVMDYGPDAVGIGVVEVV